MYSNALCPHCHTKKQKPANPTNRCETAENGWCQTHVQSQFTFKHQKNEKCISRDQWITTIFSLRHVWKFFLRMPSHWFASIFYPLLFQDTLECWWKSRKRQTGPGCLDLHQEAAGEAVKLTRLMHAGMYTTLQTKILKNNWWALQRTTYIFYRTFPIALFYNYMGHRHILIIET